MISPIKNVFAIATAVALLGMATPGLADAPKMKMTTDIPESIIIPDEFENQDTIYMFSALDLRVGCPSGLVGG